jgi:diaminohydroxyphosphoribosylaminopyrimidine deaminase / 5-amino-6-(5-phosphoribosylamino)uracil reductase
LPDPDLRYMKRALRLADRGWGHVHPNPLVGSVIVRDGNVVGTGWHETWGGPHAEVAALQAAGPLARGATLYVTLEPCAHHGKTPPCADAIIEAGVRRVVYAAADPDPKAGGGADVLRAAGLAVQAGPGERAARRQNAAFHHLHERHAPFVAVKLALSLDGAIAAGAGLRTDITGTEAQLATHRLRAGFDGILIGAGTARVDDPLLTVRGPLVPRVAPARIVIATSGDLSLKSRLLQTIADAPVHVVHGPGITRDRAAALRSAGAVLHRVAGGPRGVDLAAALDSLHHAGLQTLLCEGGARLATALLAGHHVQRLYAFVAPRVLGPDGVRGLCAPLPGDWQLWRMRRYGRDALLVYDNTTEV